jgi:transglutaminase superfamily protein
VAHAPTVRASCTVSCGGNPCDGLCIGDIKRGGRCRILPLACQRWLTQGWLRVRVGLWLCGLPLRLRVYPLPTLLHRLTRVCRTQGPLIERDDAVATVVRLCQARLFRLPFFPRSCLRQALALSYVLTRMGYPVTIHFGVRKAGGALHGHSWVTCQGMPVAEHTRTDLFTIVYSYPASAGRVPPLVEAYDMPRRS